MKGSSSLKGVCRKSAFYKVLPGNHHHRRLFIYHLLFGSMITHTVTQSFREADAAPFGVLGQCLSHFCSGCLGACIRLFFRPDFSNSSLSTLSVPDFLGNLGKGTVWMHGHRSRIADEMRANRGTEVRLTIAYFQVHSDFAFVLHTFGTDGLQARSTCISVFKQMLFPRVFETASRKASNWRER